jgi:hypothetical protein
MKLFEEFENGLTEKKDEEKEQELFNSLDTRRALKKQSVSPEEIEKYIQQKLSFHKEGGRYMIDAGAPGIGKFIYKITRISKDGNIFGRYLPEESDVRDLDPSEVE